MSLVEIASEEIEVVDLIDEDEARNLTNEIRQGLAVARVRIVKLVQGRGWLALGYRTFDEYVATEFDGPLLPMPKEERASMVAALRAIGMSTRTIATTLGVNDKTVRNDLSGADFSAPDSVVGADGKTYPAQQPERAEPLQVEAEDRGAGEAHSGQDIPADDSAPVGPDGSPEPAQPAPEPATVTETFTTTTTETRIVDVDTGEIVPPRPEPVTQPRVLTEAEKRAAQDHEHHVILSESLRDHLLWGVNVIAFSGVRADYIANYSDDLGKARPVADIPQTMRQVADVLHEFANEWEASR